MIKFPEVPALEDMPEDVRKAYKSTNRIRIVSLFIGLALAIVIYIVIFMSLIDNKAPVTDFLWGPLAFGLTFGGFIHGWIHFEFAYKSFFRAGAQFNLLLGLILCIIPYMVSSMCGGCLLVVDLILFIKKKPLIYPFEYKQFLKYRKDEDVVKDLENQFVSQQMKRQDTMDSLQKLADMRDKGIITEEEFEAKKAELLQHI